MGRIWRIRLRSSIEKRERVKRSVKKGGRETGRAKVNCWHPARPERSCCCVAGKLSADEHQLERVLCLNRDDDEEDDGDVVVSTCLLTEPKISIRPNGPSGPQT